jgi:hypothetical protein
MPEPTGEAVSCQGRLRSCHGGDVVRLDFIAAVNNAYVYG